MGKVKIEICDVCSEPRMRFEKGWCRYHGYSICRSCMMGLIRPMPSPAVEVETDKIGFREEKDNERV